MSIELKDPDSSNLNSLVDSEQEELLLRMRLNQDLSEQEIVEVVSPLVLGDGSVNYIQTTTMTTTTDLTRPKFQLSDNRLSLNDKMKNVLVELLENEKVKLNRSLSMTDSDVEGAAEEEEGDEDDVDNGAAGDQLNNNSSHKMNTVFIVREKLINDYYDYESEEHCQVFENPNASFDDVRTEHSLTKDQENNNSEEDLLLKQKIISELNVSAAAVQPQPETDKKEEEEDDEEDESFRSAGAASQSEESSSVPSTPQTPSTPSHIPVPVHSSATTSSSGANKKNKKKKNRRK